MKRRRTRTGDGTAWLVVDSVNGEYMCYWYAGPGDGQLMERARVADASDAVAWGRLRTSRVRIRTPDHCTSWAGTAPTPQGFNHTWVAPDQAESRTGLQKGRL
jgi:cytidine deaminase